MCEATPAAEITLPDHEHSARRARAFLSEAYCALHHARVLDEAQLLVSELVTNAVRHGGPPGRTELVTSSEKSSCASPRTRAWCRAK